MSLPRGTALVVDDDGRNRRLLRAILSNEGFEVQEAGDGRDALEAVTKGGIGLVVSDVMMPFVDGYRLVYELRQRGSGIPLILVTGSFSEPGDVELGIEMGADAVLGKPVDAGKLLEAIATVAARGPVTRPHSAGDPLVRYASRLAEKLNERSRRVARGQRALLLQNQELAEVSRTLLLERRRADLILDSTADGMLGIDRDGCLTFVNPAASKALGRSKQDLVGRPAHDALHPGLDARARDCRLCGAAARGRVEPRMEDTFVDANGRSFPVEWTAALLGSPGASQGVVVAFHDATDRQQREALKLEKERARMFRAAFDGLPVGIVIGSLDGRMTRVNQAFADMVETAADSLTGTAWGPFATAEEGAKAVAHAEKLLAGATENVIELTFRARGGGSVPASTSWTIVRNDDGSPAYFIGSVRDLRASRKAELERERALAAAASAERLASLGTLVAGVAHEINNPLMYIQGSVEMLQSAAKGLIAEGAPHADVASTMVVDAEAAMRGLDRIARITRSLRQVAVGAQGPRVPTGLDELVQSTLAVAAPRIGANVRVEADLEGHSIVDVDANAISQVLLNLFVNAGDAMGDRPGRLGVRTREDGSHAVVEVQDTGGGIPPALQAQIFTPFLTSKPQGTGLGLSISRSLVKEHGGELEFTSVPGEGTTFRMRLPKAPRRGSP